MPQDPSIWHAVGVARDPAVETASWYSRGLGLISTALPFGLALTRAASSGQWRDDLPAVRDLGLVAVGVGGGVATVVTQALSLVPLGSRSFRAALGSALALAVAARLLYGLVLRMLREMSAPAGSAQAPPPSRLAAVLASIATLTATLSPTWQREGTVGGGAMIGTAAALAALSLAQRCAASARLWIALGALLGAAFAESPPAALALAVTFATLALETRLRGNRPAFQRPAAGILVTSGIACFATTALLLAPLALRPSAPRAWIDVGRALSTVSLSALDVASARTTALRAWIHEVGAVSLGIAAFGVAAALARGRTRVLVAPVLAVVALDVVLPARAAGVLSADPLTSLRSLTVAALAVGSALGVHTAASYLLRARVPLARSAAVLVVVFHLTLIALTSEEAGFAADRSEQFATEAWTDEALGRIEPRSAILVRSPAIAWRLWAARLTRGERPDVLVIPAPLLDKGRVASSLIAAEPELSPLLRSYALTGAPNEFALSKLADVRPLLVEFDPAWTPRLISHLAAAGLWLQYAPQPLGPSDRKLSTVASILPLKRVVAAINAPTVPDAPTSSVVVTALRSFGSVFSALGERDAADMFIGRIDDLSARDPFVAELSPPYALKGVRRALARGTAGRAR